MSIKNNQTNNRGIMPSNFYTILLALVLVLCTNATLATTKDINIGVLAVHGDSETLASWRPTAAYLSKQLPEFRFIIRPLSLDAMNAAVADDQLHFILSNPGQYVLLEFRFGISRLVTLRNLRHGTPYTKFGAVIFTRASEKDIRNLKDLEGRSFAAVGKRALGGFQMAWRELQEQGVDPFDDFSSLQFVGFPQDKVVKRVLAGKVDAGTVRTDVLERLANRGKISLSDIKVLNLQKHSNFSFLLSTRLYPEWPFAKAHRTPENLAKRVAMALLSMGDTHKAALASHSAGWTVPLDYSSIHQLFRVLKVEPYSVNTHPMLGILLIKYWYILLILFLTVVFIVFHDIRTKRLVVQRTSLLEKVKRELELDIENRIGIQRALQESESRLQAILDNTSAIIYVKNYEGRYLLVNKAFENLFGLKSSQILDVSPEKIFPQQTVSCFRESDLKVWESQRAEEFEESIEVEGSLRTFISVKFPILLESGVSLALGGVSTEITSRKQVEGELRMYQEHLQELVVERSAELSLAQRELEAFMYSLAHDLRTPLRAITSFSQIVAQDAAERLSDHERDSIARVVAAAKHMAVMLEQMQELNSISKKELVFEAVNLTPLVNDICQHLAQTLPQRTMDWKVEPDLIVNGDCELIITMLKHLLENAWQYTDKAAHPCVEVVSHNNNGHQEIMIRDNGIGFEMKYAKKILQPFQRLHSITEYPGSGIGLAVVVRILERHGGTIRAESKPGDGATFIFNMGEP